MQSIRRFTLGEQATWQVPRLGKSPAVGTKSGADLWPRGERCRPRPPFCG